MNTNIKTDTRLITISSDSATLYNNGDFLSDMYFKFDGMLKDEDDIIYSQISIHTAQIPISFYIVNVYNNKFVYKYFNDEITTVYFDVGNYNANTFLTYFNSVIPHVTLSFNKINGKFTISSNHAIYIYPDSTCYKLLGLKAGISYSDTTNPYIIQTPFPCQFQGISRIKINSNELSGYSMDSATGSYSPLIDCITVNSSAFGVILFQNITNLKTPLRNKILTGFDIQFLDDDNNLINFNGCEWNLTIELNIIRQFYIVDRTFPKLQPESQEEAPEAQEEAPETQPETEPEDNNNMNVEPTDDDDLDLLLYKTNNNIT
jgi:hypothetical protein